MLRIEPGAAGSEVITLSFVLWSLPLLFMLLQSSYHSQSKCHQCISHMHKHSRIQIQEVKKFILFWDSNPRPFDLPVFLSFYHAIFVVAESSDNKFVCNQSLSLLISSEHEMRSSWWGPQGKERLRERERVTKKKKRNWEKESKQGGWDKEKYVIKRRQRQNERI